MTHSCEATTKFSAFFFSMQPVFIGLAHHPTFRMLRGKSPCILGYSYLTCRLCRNATVTIANRSGLLVML